jgi:putative colanic acid biosynthesis UDP-glucose lipid carrier transferase
MTAARARLQALAERWRDRAVNERRVIIVGYGDTGRELHHRAAALPGRSYRIVATCDADGATPLDARIDVLNDLGVVGHAVERHRAHEVWIALPLSAGNELAAIRHQLANALVDIRWVPDLSALRLLSQHAAHFLGMPVIDLNRPAAAGIAGAGKAMFDRVFAAVALLGLSPLLMAIAIAIKCTSPGPVLFSQPRLGLNGRRFPVLKFRSMHVHREQDGQVTQATRSDPRITRIGHVLRRTSLDELPQFFNVLAGQMSVVGPRPHALPHNDLYKDKLAMYMQRHRVKPGITGWAQINGCRGETDSLEKMARRVELDLDYIRHWSFLLDLKIIVWTALRGWSGDHAY